MNPNILALRAITAVFFRRILKFIAIIGAILIVLLWALVIYLSSTVSGWWGLLFIILVPLGLIAAIVAAVLWGATSKIMPKRLSTAETKKIHVFTGKLFGLVEAAKTPYPIQVALIAKDVLSGRESGFLRNVIQDSRSLKGEFDDIKRMLG